MLLKYPVCLLHIRPLPPFLTIFHTHKVNNSDKCCGFLEEQQFILSGTFIGTKLKGIKATYVISGDRDDPV